MRPAHGAHQVAWYHRPLDSDDPLNRTTPHALEGSSGRALPPASHLWAGHRTDWWWPDNWCEIARSDKGTHDCGVAVQRCRSTVGGGRILEGGADGACGDDDDRRR